LKSSEPQSTATPERELTIGYLQVGPPEHGICRHGRLLASEARRRSNLVVLERSLCLESRPGSDRTRLKAAANELSAADVVHLQVSVSGDGTWGRNRRSLTNLEIFKRQCRVPVVATLHDLNNLLMLRCTSSFDWLRRAAIEVAKTPFRPAVRLARQLGRGRIDLAELFRSTSRFDGLYSYRIARWTVRRTEHLLVASGGEAETLRSLGMAVDVTMIPLFIESGLVRQPSSVAKPGGRKRIIVAGFIFKNKGYDVMIKALALLPHVELVLVGGPRLGAAGSETLSRLMEVAREHRVADRLHVTGYLAEEEYQKQLGDAELAVCPFEADKSASGSLGSIIAAGCPVLASDVPVIAEYNAIKPGAIPTFSPYTPESLARAIEEQLRKPRPERARDLAILRERLSIRVIYDRHLEVYRRVRRS
jgi:glycosyltransferase involved in cell wall biosynthesis